MMKLAKSTKALAAAFSAAVLVTVGAGASAATIVVSNNVIPGDAFTNPGPSNQGQAVAGSGWYYNNVRNGGTVGIDTAFPRNGNGAARFVSQDGGDKADIEFLPNAVNWLGNYLSGASLGAFSSLSGFGYEWYRGSASTIPGHLHPVIRVLLDADGNLLTTTDRGGLVFERVYMEASGWTAPTDTWVAESIGATSYLWSFGLGLPFAADIDGNGYGYDATLAQWKAFLPNAVILGFSMGVGSGWNGYFVGAVDSASWTIAGQTSAFNFEVRPGAAVAEPASLALLAIALFGVAAARSAGRAGRSVAG